jgi:hypothetical protein
MAITAVYCRFVEFMKNWTQTEMPDLMSVAFSSERSLQDELERESEAEIVTVVISYVVMFVYIAVALGQFRSFKTLLVSTPGQCDRTTRCPIKHLLRGLQKTPYGMTRRARPPSSSTTHK